MRRNDGLGVEVVREMAAAADPTLADRQVVGIGFATVDLDRAALDALHDDGSAWLPAPRDDLLGARALRRSGDESESPTFILLEPDTEGRLAASLARFGEGVAVIYLAGRGRPADEPLSSERGAKGRAPARSPLGPAGDGPLGRGRLLIGLPAWGPHVIVLEGARG